MFVRKFLKNQADTDSNVYVSMNNTGADVEENGDSVVKINEHIDCINHPNEQVCVLVLVDFTFLLL